jgi:hypothetical protein
VARFDALRNVGFGEREPPDAVRADRAHVGRRRLAGSKTGEVDDVVQTVRCPAQRGL